MSDNPNPKLTEDIGQPPALSDLKPTLQDALVNLTVLQGMLDDALTAHRPAWIPCAAGCAWCCWQMNELVSWLEAAAIFNVVRTWGAARKAALVQRAQMEVDALVADPDIAQFVDSGAITPDRLPVLAAAFRKHVRPCAFLNRASDASDASDANGMRDLRGTCSIYEVRPMHCRVFGQSVVERRGEEQTAFYGCAVAAEDVRAHIESDDEVALFDVTQFFKAQRLMEGAPNVLALPLAFWVKTLAEGTEWSLDYPENLFERFMNVFQPMRFEAKRGGDGDAAGEAMGNGAASGA